MSLLLHELVEGVDIRFTGRRVSSRCPNLPTALERPEIIDENLLEDLHSGKIIGPFDSPPSNTFRLCPVGLVPKKAHGEAIPGKFRRIDHLSYPKEPKTFPDGTEWYSVNDEIEIPSEELPAWQEFLAAVSQFGPGCFMAKSDVVGAFRNIGVAPKDRELLGFRWRNKYYAHTVLPFGLRSAPYLWGRLAQLILRRVRYECDARGLQAFITLYVDDYLMAGASSADANACLEILQSVCRRWRIMLAEDKTFRATQEMEVLGVIVNTLEMTLSMHPGRMSSTRRLLQQVRSCATVSSSILESVAGKLTWLVRAIPQGRLFTQRIYEACSMGKCVI